MIHGYFNRGCPHVVAQLAIPSLPVSGPVAFVIDTGADETVLLPNEATMLGINYDKLVDCPVEETLGLGGGVPAFVWVYSAADLIRLSSRVVAPLIFERDDCRLATSHFAVGFIANDP